MDAIFATKLLIGILIVLFLSGYFIYSIFLRKLNMDFFQGLIVSLGLSLVFIPIITYFFTIIGLKLNNTLILIYFITLVVILILKYINEYKNKEWGFFNFKKLIKSLEKYDLLTYFILVCILIISLFVRFISLKDILVAPGSDSYHHTLIVQLIIENGGIPHSYEPYAPLSSFTYHFGFHNIVAFIYWVSGIDPVKLVLYIGQVLNSFVVLTIFIFVDRLFKNRMMALLSSLITGLISIFPAYYVNWGRFTQLTGMLILPIALLLVIESIKIEKRDHKVLFVSGLLISGLFLAHYRVVIAFFSFALLYILFGICQYKDDWKVVEESLIRFFIISLVAFILLLPWLIHLMNEPQILLSSNHQVSASGFSIERIGNAFNYYSNLPLLLLSLGGVLLGLFNRNKYIILITLWFLILIAFSNPFWLKLPGSGLLDFITVVTILYVPISIISSYFITYLLQRIKISFSHTLFFICLAIMVPFFAINMIGVFSPENVYVKSGDLNAMNWIKANTEGNSTFLISAYSFDFMPEFITGVDGGYWIPLFTKRNTTIPPMTYLLERQIENNYVEKVIALSKAEESITSGSTIDFLVKNNISYIYFGGRTWGKLKLEDLQNNPYLEPVYGKDGVWIFRITKK